MKSEFWKGKRVFLTGHTGFKGSWLAFILSEIGAKVCGYSIDVPTRDSLYKALGISGRIEKNVLGDVCDESLLLSELSDFEPEIVFHLAAQALVIDSYEDPVKTYRDNVMGTLSLLNAVRRVGSVKSCLIVTTDKVYQNQETLRAYKETDPLGGHDPYSSSKACTEIVTESMRKSFFSEEKIRISTARAGNVFGGGDWARNRIVTDLVKSVLEQKPVVLRNPSAIRPWQHAFEPLVGYLKLAQANYLKQLESHSINFGPDSGSEATVEDLVNLFYEKWGAPFKAIRGNQAVHHEAQILKLDNTKARELLGWSPCWDMSRALAATVEWYQAYYSGHNLDALSRRQLLEYLEESKVDL
jgi:CDP-glucose 4,6-dehydratase